MVKVCTPREYWPMMSALDTRSTHRDLCGHQKTGEREMCDDRQGREREGDKQADSKAILKMNISKIHATHSKTNTYGITRADAQGGKIAQEV